CSICGRNLIGRPRAHTCLLNHTGTKPYACNGACGIEDCPKSYASKAHLKRHCAPIEGRVTLCPSWYIRSKQNLARHLRKCSQRPPDL
ncbi:hypothetical protein CPB86DRAFT_744974, partial [Serendipita vermifera]